MNNIVQIVSFQKDDAGWWAEVIEGSRSGKYEDHQDWMKLRDVYSICEECVESGHEEENFLVGYVRDYPKKVQWAVANEIAVDLMGSSITEVFGVSASVFKGYKKPSGTTNTGDNTTRKQTQPKSTGRVGSKPSSNTCKLSRSDPGNFKAINVGYYFVGRRKYCELSCHGCHKLFASDRNKEKGNCDDMIPLPTARVATYVCLDFEVDKCACGTMLCHSCYVGILDAGNRKRRRGHREADVSQKSRRT